MDPLERGGGVEDSFESEVISYYLKSLLRLEREVINPGYYYILVAWWCWLKAIECRKAMQALRGWRWLVGSPFDYFGRTFEFITENGNRFLSFFLCCVALCFVLFCFFFWSDVITKVSDSKLRRVCVLYVCIIVTVWENQNQKQCRVLAVIITFLVMLPNDSSLYKDHVSS